MIFKRFCSWTSQFSNLYFVPYLGTFLVLGFCVLFCFFTSLAFSFKGANIIPLLFLDFLHHSLLVSCHQLRLVLSQSIPLGWIRDNKSVLFFWTYASIQWGQKRYNMFKTIVFLSTVFFSWYWLQKCKEQLQVMPHSSLSIKTLDGFQHILIYQLHEGTESM